MTCTTLWALLGLMQFTTWFHEFPISNSKSQIFIIVHQSALVFVVYWLGLFCQINLNVWTIHNIGSLGVGNSWNHVLSSSTFKYFEIPDFCDLVNHKHHWTSLHYLAGWCLWLCGVSWDLCNSPHGFTNSQFWIINPKFS